MSKQSEATDESVAEQKRWRIDVTKALLAGATAIALGMASTLAMGNISGAEALHLLERVVDVLPYFCGSAMTASATILALMLTLLGVGNNTELELSKRYYVRVRLVGRLAAGVFISSMLLLLFVTIPLPDSDKATQDWHINLYYVTAGAASLLGGVMVFLIMMLYATVSDVIEIVGFGKREHHFVRRDQDEESK